MQKKSLCALLLTAVFLLSLTGCGADKNAVYVQSVAELSGIGAIAPGDRFPGMVVSENVTEIQKDNDKTVEELHIKEDENSGVMWIPIQELESVVREPEMIPVYRKLLREYIKDAE